MKILIVDDVSDNREILERLINRYSRKYETPCEIFQAENGKEAVELSQKQSIDLIFMDIMMPVMDGLEATKIIKKASPSTMIIVVSSENDEAIKLEILQSGAEDYVLKPFSSSIMISRLNNYHKLIASRHVIGFQPRSINLFTHSIYSYQLKFFVGHEDDLAQFWETMLVRYEYQKHIQNLSDFVRFIFQLGSYQIKKSYKCHIYLEEDADYFYFTMDTMKLLSKELIHKTIEKHYPLAVYELKEDLISFVLPQVTENQAVAVETQPKEEALKPKAKPEQEAHKEVELRTYDLLEKEALAEFEHIVSKLKTEISLMGSSELEIDDIDTMNEYIQQLAAILSVSQDAYTIAESLHSFARLLGDYSEEFLAKSQDLSHMVHSFVNDIIMWKEMIFYQGAPSVDFLNSSIISSVEMIRAVFASDETAEDLDDIFDF